jgi:excisionase family DNA binding protein
MIDRQLLYTYREAAAVLALCERTIWSLVDRGLLRAVSIGKSRRISADDLREYVSRLREESRVR